MNDGYDYNYLVLLAFYVNRRTLFDYRKIFIGTGELTFKSKVRLNSIENFNRLKDELAKLYPKWEASVLNIINLNDL